MVRRAESYVNNKRLLLKKEGWSDKEFLQEGNASVGFKNPLGLCLYSSIC